MASSRINPCPWIANLRWTCPRKTEIGREYGIHDPNLKLDFCGTSPPYSWHPPSPALTLDDWSSRTTYTYKLPTICFDQSWIHVCPWLIEWCGSYMTHRQRWLTWDTTIIYSNINIGQGWNRTLTAVCQQFNSRKSLRVRALNTSPKTLQHRLQRVGK